MQRWAVAGRSGDNSRPAVKRERLIANGFAELVQYGDSDIGRLYRARDREEKHQRVSSRRPERAGPTRKKGELLYAKATIPPGLEKAGRRPGCRRRRGGGGVGLGQGRAPTHADTSVHTGQQSYGEELSGPGTPR